jgi:large subunit ribosomal protein L2
MAIKLYKPTSAGRRGMSVLDYSHLTAKAPERSLLIKMKKSGGRNSHGRATIRYRGGGARKRYRVIDFRRDKDEIPARVAALEYDPGRNANIALLHYRDGEKRYILAPDLLKVGQQVLSGPKAEPDVGNCLPFTVMPLGTVVHCVEMHPGRGGQIARSAGMSARFQAREGGKAILLMPSGEMRMVPVECRGTIGVVGNSDYSNVILGKAGRTRHRGRRGHVRGMCRNPVDHPMGGGSGRAKGHIPRSPWGLLAKGGKTRQRKRFTNNQIIRHRPMRRGLEE